MKNFDDFNIILTHKFDLDEEIKQKVIDANIKDSDRYDIFDPRNVLNKRKREEIGKVKPTKSTKK